MIAGMEKMAEGLRAIYEDPDVAATRGKAGDE